MPPPAIQDAFDFFASFASFADKKTGPVVRDSSMRE